MEDFLYILLTIAILVGVGVVGVYWRNHPGPVWLVYLASLGVTIYGMSTESEGVLFTIGVSIVIFLSLTLFGLMVVLILEDVGQFGKKLTQGRTAYLHEHGDLGWHDHPYERNHRHYGNHMNGPFYYVDERVIDQR